MISCNKENTIDLLFVIKRGMYWLIDFFNVIILGFLEFWFILIKAYGLISPCQC